MAVLWIVAALQEGDGFSRWPQPVTLLLACLGEPEFLHSLSAQFLGSGVKEERAGEKWVINNRLLGADLS